MIAKSRRICIIESDLRAEQTGQMLETTHFKVSSIGMGWIVSRIKTIRGAPYGEK